MTHPRRKSKHWCFTINNPTPSDNPFPVNASYLVYGHETSDSGTPHYQGYIIYNKLCYATAVTKHMPRAAHYIKYKDSTPLQASTYCKKDGNFIEYGTLPGNTSHDIWALAYQSAIDGNFDDIPKSMLIRYYHCFKRIRQDNPPTVYNLSHRDNIWILAPTGYGKSTYARKTWPDFYDKPPNKWFIAYKGQSTILLDDFGPSQFFYLSWYIKRWADIFPFPAETKGGGQTIRPLHIIVTSQYTIDQCFPDDSLLADAVHNRFKYLKLAHWNPPDPYFSIKYSIQQ